MCVSVSMCACVCCVCVLSNDWSQLSLAPGRIRLQSHVTLMFIFFFFLQPSLFHSFLGAASENVLVHQMFQCKLTQTGSLVPPNQRLQLRRSKGALLLHMPSSASTPRHTQKYLELKKVHILQKISNLVSYSYFFKQTKSPFNHITDLRNPKVNKLYMGVHSEGLYC